MGTPFSFIGKLFGQKKAHKPSQVRTITNGAKWSDVVEAFQNYGGGPTTKAMRVSAVYACVDRKSKDIASLPLRPMQKTGSGSEIARDSDLYFIAKSPSTKFTLYQWLYTLNSHIELYGECFAPITRKNGRPVELDIWHPCKVELKEVEGRMYWVNTDTKQVKSDDDMVHIMWFTEDGKRGKSVLSYARETVDLAYNGAKMSASLYKNQMWQPGYLSFKGDFTPDQADLISKTWSSNYMGEDNQMNIPVLDQEGKFLHFGMSLKDSEYLGTIEHSVKDIARFFGVPGSKIGITSQNVSYNSLEQENIAYVQDTIMPRVISWEQELNRKCISEADFENIYFKFELKSRLRGDMAARSAFYDMALRNGLLSINDGLRLEDMDTIGPEGDERYVNAAQVPLSKLYSGELDAVDTADKEISKLLKGIKTNGHAHKG